MGPIAARKALKVLENTERILGIEALAAAQALDLRKPLVPANGPNAARTRLRQEVAFLSADRILHEDLEDAAELVRSGALLAAAEAVVGSLS
jgi:histidine ammonia-lyase